MLFYPWETRLGEICGPKQHGIQSQRLAEKFWKNFQFLKTGNFSMLNKIIREEVQCLFICGMLTDCCKNSQNEEPQKCTSMKYFLKILQRTEVPI